MSDAVSISCRKCRQVLIQDKELLNAHNEIPQSAASSELCNTLMNQTCYYIKEEAIVEWIHQSVESTNWTKGKLNCPKCEARIGSFDFISGTKCECGDFILPPVHLVKSKIDVKNNNKQLLIKCQKLISNE